jgi:uncharacterized protein YndB with AHSA1/START domain
LGTIEKSVTIAVTPEKAFDYLSNIENHAKYAPHVKKLWVTSDKKRGIGVTFKQILRREIDQLDLEVDSEVIEYVENRKITWHNRYSNGEESDITYSVEPEKAGSKVTFRGTFYNISDEKALARIGTNVDAVLKRLKEVLEEKTS